MSKFNWIEGGSVTSVPGFRAAGVTAGFKRSGAPDFAMIASDVPANFAGAFTSCTFAAAPVQVCRKRVLESEYLRAAAINSGNANACTGATGIANAERTCELVAVPARRQARRKSRFPAPAGSACRCRWPPSSAASTSRRRPSATKAADRRRSDHDHRHRAQIGRAAA